MGKKKTAKAANGARKPGWPKGRARLPDGQRFGDGGRIEAWFLPDDYLRVKAAAERAGKLLSEFVRDAIFAALDGESVKPR